MDHPSLPAMDDLRILLVTENTLLASLLCSQFREAGGPSVSIVAPGAIEERGLEKLDRGTALLLDTNAFNRLYRLLSDVTSHNAVVVIAEQISLILVRKVLEIGGRGIIPTDFDPDLFRMALFMALRGETFFPSSAWLPTLRMSTDCDLIGTPESEDRPPITWREREILNQLFQGISNKLIAYNLGITEATVKMHMSNLSRKLDAKNRTQLLVNAMRRGFVAPLMV
jgi:DNA-binding NarL/FixJ family response regulator